MGKPAIAKAENMVRCEEKKGNCQEILRIGSFDDLFRIGLDFFLTLANTGSENPCRPYDGAASSS